MHSFAAQSDPVTEESALAPLRRPGFRAAWTALAGSQLVIWMNTVGAVTVIAAVSDSSTLIALVQTANSVPAVLLALLTGAVADIVDRPCAGRAPDCDPQRRRPVRDRGRADGARHGGRGGAPGAGAEACRPRAP